MGNSASWFSRASEPPSVVLVPPLLERERKGRSRFAKNSYERQFARPQLALLFGDYLGPDLRSILYFSPPDDQRVSVTAKLGVARGLALSGAQMGKGRLPHPTGPAYGSMALRFEPDPRHPYTFVDVKTGVPTADAALAATIRGCFVNAESGVAAHAELPLDTGAGSGPLLQPDNLRVGARYTSPGLSVGALLAPSSGNLEEAWIVGRSAGMVWGASTKPGLALGSLLSGQRLEGDPRPAGTRALDACLGAASYGLAYSPGGDASSQHGRFTMALELIEERKLSVAFLYHMAVQRNVHNPFEGSDVLGITNYLDIGFQMVSDMRQPDQSVLRIGTSWQANKNVMVKARAGLDGFSVAAVVRSWWQPAFTCALAASYDLRTGQTRLGATAAVESFHHLRYERSPEGNKMAGARLTQRHVASAEDEAYHKGKGILVPLSEVDNPDVLGQRAPIEGELL